VKIEAERVKLKISFFLKAVARERSMKTQQAGKKNLAGAKVICKVWRLAIAL
jgi:hypothetical protein